MKHLKLLLIVLVILTGKINAQWTRLETSIDSVGSLKPIIDGLANDSIWKTVPINKIERLFANDSTEWNTTIPLNEDMSGYWQAVWSPEGLYILVKTESDDTIPVLMSNGASWEQERIQIYFDLSIDSLQDGNGNKQDQTYHPIIDVTRYATANQEIAGFAGSKMAIAVNPNYSGVSEFYVPWSALKTRANVPYIPSSIEPLGFDVILVDNDGPKNPPARTRRLWCSFADPYFIGDSIGRISFNHGIDTLQLALPSGPEVINTENFQIIGYLPSYRFSSINSIDLRGLTQLNLSFANPSSDGTLSIGGNIDQVKTALGTQKTKLMISIGGGGVTATIADYYKNLLKDANRSAFIDKIMDFINTNSLDGLDLDLEGALVEIPEYNKFVTDVATKLHSAGKIITITIPNWSGSIINDATYDAIDWINVMSYDATGPWTPSNPGAHAPYSKFLSDFDYFNTSRKIHGSKIVMGVPFYGYEFASATVVNTLTYSDIITKYPSAVELDVVNGNLYYNGKPTIIEKTKYMKQYGGGIMIWELGQDSHDNNSLLAAIYTAAGLNLPAVSVSSVSDNNIPQCYPSLFSETINIKLAENISNATVEIFNLMGAQISTEKLKNTNNTLNVSALPKGMYLIRVETAGKFYNYKAVKE